MKILGLWKNDTEITGSQTELQDAIVDYSGAGDEYDFFYVVRSFTFFLEDKVSLIWNPQGQFEIFRILFFGPRQARKLAHLADAIKTLDSQHRNRRTALNRRRKNLKEAAAATGELSQIEKALQEAQLAADELEAQLGDTEAGD